MGKKTYTVLCKVCAISLNYLLVFKTGAKCEFCNKRTGYTVCKKAE